MATSIPSQAEKGTAFRALHERDRAFVIPNPWSVGTAHLLMRQGFEALATTSAGFAFSVAKRDNQVGRDEMIEHVRQICAATPLPVSADLENGFADAPAEVAETIRLGAAAGLVGGSIEDARAERDEPIYEREFAAERVRAAVEVARGLPFPFLLTARAENHLYGRTDLADTIGRLQAYQDAGADVLFAPGLASAEEISSLVSSVDRPVNVLMGRPGFDLTVADLSALGVRRISVGSGLARVALAAFLRAAREIRESGSFRFGEEALSMREISALFDPDQS